MPTRKNITNDKKKENNVEDASYSVDFLKSIIDFLADPLFVKDEHHRWVLLNRAMLDWMGQPLERLIGKSDYDLSPKAEADVFWEQDNRVLASEHSIENEEKHTTNDGIQRTTLTNKIAIHLPNGQAFIVGTIRDITDRKKAEEIIAKRANQLQVAFEVSQVVSSLIDQKDLIQQVVDLICSRFNLYYVGLFLIDEPDISAKVWGKRAELKAGTGEAGRELIKNKHSVLINDNSMIGRCITLGKPQITFNLKEGIGRFNSPLLPETRSEVALPMVTRGKTIGSLTIQSSQEDAFSPEDITTFQTLTNLLASSIENARLFHQTQMALEEMQEVQRKYVKTLFGR
jgi:PAS domain S-box-containing protein